MNYFSKINYDLNLDALWKWATIWKVVKELGLLDKPFRCVDIGGGLSPLHYIFSNYGEVTNVELAGFKRAWFPVNPSGFYVNSKGIKHNRKNIKYVQDDFLKYVKKLPSNSIDFFYDSCSLIHFNPKKSFSYNDGVSIAMKEITRVLRPGGYFISTSHIAHPDASEVRDMIHPRHLGKCFTSTGLQYASKVDWELEPFFMDKKNLHHPGSFTQPFQKNTPRACTTCRGLPKYHCLYEICRETIVISCLYTLYKPKKINYPLDDSYRPLNQVFTRLWWLMRRIIFFPESVNRKVRKIINMILAPRITGGRIKRKIKKVIWKNHLFL